MDNDELDELNECEWELTEDQMRLLDARWPKALENPPMHDLMGRNATTTLYWASLNPEP